MVNTDDFIKRLEILLEYYSLSASIFADKIGVQRSSISHLLSGRNKPSLDFIMKIIAVFPDLNLYWMLDGKGDFLKNKFESNLSSNTKVETVFNPTQDNIEAIEKSNLGELKNAEAVLNKNVSETISSSNSTSKERIFKIVIFYDDGTFKDFNYNNS